MDNMISQSFLLLNYRKRHLFRASDMSPFIIPVHGRECGRGSITLHRNYIVYIELIFDL